MANDRKGFGRLKCDHGEAAQWKFWRIQITLAQVNPWFETLTRKSENITAVPKGLETAGEDEDRARRDNKII